MAGFELVAESEVDADGLVARVYGTREGRAKVVLVDTDADMELPSLSLYRSVVAALDYAGLCVGEPVDLVTR